jgi:hypothetical protein
MPRNGSTIPADLIGKLEWLRVECQKCGVSTMPTDLMLTTWLSDLTGDCPRRNTHAIGTTPAGRAALIFPSSFNLGAPRYAPGHADFYSAPLRDVAAGR